MKTINEKQIGESLRRAARDLTPGDAGALWDMPVERAGEDAWFLEGSRGRRAGMRPLFWAASLAAACLAVFLISWNLFYRTMDAMVYLDVNPSLSLEVSRTGRVLAAEAQNPDGETILGDMDLRGTQVQVAVNALLGSMYRGGYLSAGRDAVLISVEGRNEERARYLQQTLSEEAGQTLDALMGGGVILSQQVDADADMEDLAEDYGISPGKAAVISRLKAMDPSLEIRDLAGMPMADLIRLCLSEGIDPSGILGEDGELRGELASYREDLEDRDDPDGLEDEYDEDDYGDSGHDGSDYDDSDRDEDDLHGAEEDTGRDEPEDDDDGPSERDEDDDDNEDDDDDD